MASSKTDEFAPGIPAGRPRHALPVIDQRTSWRLAVQEHHADRAGHHYDFRLVDPKTGHAHSWALPKARLPNPGEMVLAVPQPTHTAEYATTFGKRRPQTIEAGYGKGTVSMKVLEEVDVHRVDEKPRGTVVEFNRYTSRGPQEYAIVRLAKGGDLLVNKTVTRDKAQHLPLGDKPKFRELDFDAVDPTDDSQLVLPKYDGAHTLLDLNKPGEKVRLFSYRVPKRHDAGLIEHTHRIPRLTNLRVPKEHAGTVVRAETIGVDRRGKAIPARTVGGLLNSTVTKSRMQQDKTGYRLELVLLDVETYQGESVAHLPYEERHRLLQRIGDDLNLRVTEVAADEKQKSKMIDKIWRGKHPMTAEGVIVRPTGEGKAFKAKIRPDHDVYVREIHEARDERGNLKGRAGAFSYSWTPDGPIVGRIGTGFDHATAKDMLEHPEQYQGRVAKVFAETKMPSGALSKPSFSEWHLDK